MAWYSAVRLEWPLGPRRAFTEAAAAFIGNFGVYGLILFKLCVQVAYCSPSKTCYMAFAIKGQTKVAAAFKGNFGVYGLNLFKLGMQVTYCPLVMIVYMAFTVKGQTKPLSYIVWARPYGRLSGASGGEPVGPGGASSY